MNLDDYTTISVIFSQTLTAMKYTYLCPKATVKNLSRGSFVVVPINNAQTVKDFVVGMVVEIDEKISVEKNRINMLKFMVCPVPKEDLDKYNTVTKEFDDQFKRHDIAVF